MPLPWSLTLHFHGAKLKVLTQSFVPTAGSDGAGADKASLLAKNVYEGVRQRVHQLQADVQERDKHAAALQSKLDAVEQQHEAALQQSKLDQQVSLRCSCVLS